MQIKDYLTNDFTPLSPRDSIEVARLVFETYRFDYLPVVEGGRLVGCIASDFNLGAENKYFVSDFILESEKFNISCDTNLIDALRVSAINDSNLLPVVNYNNEYLGYVAQYDIMAYFSNTPFFSELGGVLVVKKAIKEYSVSEIAQIVESENAKILGLYIREFVDNQVVVVVKINLIRLANIEASFSRYGYSIQESYHENKLEDDLEERYNSLMNYLDV